MSTKQQKWSIFSAHQTHSRIIYHEYLLLKNDLILLPRNNFTVATYTGKISAIFVVTLHGPCWTTGNGTRGTQSGLDSIMWITRITLPGFLKHLLIGLEGFSE